MSWQNFELVNMFTEALTKIEKKNKNKNKKKNHPKQKKKTPKIPNGPAG